MLGLLEKSQSTESDSIIMMARKRLGQMLSNVDKEIAAGTPMRDFEEVFADIEGEK